MRSLSTLQIAWRDGVVDAKLNTSMLGENLCQKTKFSRQRLVFASTFVDALPSCVPRPSFAKTGSGFVPAFYFVCAWPEIESHSGSNATAFSVDVDKAAIFNARLKIEINGQ